jgi:hypothetical protein
MGRVRHAGSISTFGPPKSGILVGIWVVFLLISSYPVGAMEPRKSPETGMVRVLYIGEPVGGMGPYRFMVQDPFLEMSPVQATTAW